MKKQISFNEKKNFFINTFFLILISIFYEIHTNNQAITFAFIPIICGLIYLTQIEIKKDNFLKYTYKILIFLCVLKIIQHKIFLHISDNYFLHNLFFLFKKN